jgi:hypothetical protein
MDTLYEALGTCEISLADRMRLEAHRLFCPRCAAEERKLKAAWKLLEVEGSEFFPEPPAFADRVMERVYAEEADERDAPGLADEGLDPCTGVSFRGWVVTGFIVLISLGTSFFGVEFSKVAASQGSSFLLPVGLTIGCVLTGYGAIFIGSHLKEFSQRFLK